MPILDRMFVGRTCAGIQEERRILVEDGTISRTHFEIRLDPERDVAYVIDLSTNGTHLNGSRLGRAQPAMIRSGDRLVVGETQFEFRSEGFTGRSTEDPDSTRAQVVQSMMMMVAGDITNFSTISQVTDSEVVASSIRMLYSELTTELAARRGTLSYYAGDALYAVWEVKHIPDANELAVDFALAASRRVTEVAPDLPLRSSDGAPVSMGWGVVKGRGAVVALPQSAVSVIGDATNLVFRLSGLAGRDGRAPVIVTDAARVAVVDRFVWGEPELVPTKGRSGEERVYPVWDRAGSRSRSV